MVSSLITLLPTCNNHAQITRANLAKKTEFFLVVLANHASLCTCVCLYVLVHACACACIGPHLNEARAHLTHLPPHAVNVFVPLVDVVSMRTTPHTQPSSDWHFPVAFSREHATHAKKENKKEKRKTNKTQPSNLEIKPPKL